MIEFQWIRWDIRDGQPPFGAIHQGSEAQAYFQVLQYRERVNMDEVGLQDAIWSEWMNT
jgi:hypothetical protein